jgi:hypothetical protein
VFHYSPSHIQVIHLLRLLHLHPQPPFNSSPLHFPYLHFYTSPIPCPDHIPLVFATKCLLQCFLQRVLAQPIAGARGRLDRLRTPQCPLQLLNEFQSFRSVPNCPAGCQNSQIPPAKSIILSLNNMPRIYANLAPLYHTSGMPSPFVVPCAFHLLFCSGGVDA